MAVKTYERHLAREIYAATALVTLGFLALFGFFDLIHELGSVGSGGYQLQHAVAFVVLTLPGRAYETMPINVLIGTLYALTVLARHSEITVLRASGLSTTALLGSLMKIGGAFVVLVFVIGEAIAPPAERWAQEVRLQAKGAMVAQEFRSGLWMKDELAFVNIRDVLPDTTIRTVRIYTFDPQFRLLSITDAEQGRYVGEQRWRLSGLVRTVFGETGARIETESDMEWVSRLTPDLLSVLLVMPERMSLATLYQYVGYLGDNRQKTERYEIALWKKLVYPLATLVMMVLALPFAYMQDRFGSVSVRVFAGVMLGIAFHMLNGLFSSLGVINSWQPFTAAIAPSVMFLAAATVLIWWMERR